MSPQGAWEDERGFTLIEVLVTIILMLIVFGIASSTWFKVVESRRVDSATYQVGPPGDLDTMTLPGDDQGTPKTKILSATTITFHSDGSAEIDPAGDITVTTTDGDPLHTIEINPVT